MECIMGLQGNELNRIIPALNQFTRKDMAEDMAEVHWNNNNNIEKTPTMIGIVLLDPNERRRDFVFQFRIGSLSLSTLSECK